MMPAASSARFDFRNFREALAFVQRVGELAEAERTSSRRQLRLGLRDRVAEHEEDQGRIARETISSWRARSIACSISPA